MSSLVQHICSGFHFVNLVYVCGMDLTNGRGCHVVWVMYVGHGSPAVPLLDSRFLCLTGIGHSFYQQRVSWCVFVTIHPGAAGFIRLSLSSWLLVVSCWVADTPTSCWAKHSASLCVPWCVVSCAWAAGHTWVAETDTSRVCWRFVSCALHLVQEDWLHGLTSGRTGRSCMCKGLSGPCDGHVCSAGWWSCVVQSCSVWRWWWWDGMYSCACVCVCVRTC